MRVGIVTGGASGIGYGIVRHLLEEGMAVVAMDWDREACATAEKEIGTNANARIVIGDAGSEEGASLAVATAMDAFGGLDLLCNNAAVHPLETVEDHRIESWRETFRINVEGTMLCSQKALPHLKESGRGSIVNMGSIAGIVPYATGGAYAASKAAIVALTKVLALEAGPHGVTVNCICPGAIRHRADHDRDPSPPAHIPIGRYGTVRDVAQMVSFLASDAARYLTGSVITLDGGAIAGRERRSRGRRGRT